MATTSTSSLIAASRGPEDDPYGYPWFGLGLLSDGGLPFDVLPMFLAGQLLTTDSFHAKSLKVLLADTHALTTGTETIANVSARGRRRQTEVEAICELMAMRCEVIRGSTLDADSDFREVLHQVRDWHEHRDQDQDGQLSEYTIRGVADVIHLYRNGGIKIGWKLIGKPGRGDEYETDGYAAEIQPGVTARYVRHGFTLHADRPRAVPYTERGDTSVRLMLTGKDRGNFAAKLASAKISANRYAEIIDHIGISVAMFESLVEPLPGDGVVEKAEAIVELLNLD
jgi:hypothetical protein